MKFYAVRLPIRAIFTSWQECKAVVSEARYAKYKSFFSLEEARAFMEEGLVLQEQPDGDGEEEQQQEKKDEDGGGDEDDEGRGNRGIVKQESACAGGGGEEGGGGGEGGGGRRMCASSSVLTAALKEEGEMVGGGRHARKRKASASEAGGKKCEEGGGGGGGEVISLLSDSGDEDQDKGLRGGQKKRLKDEQAQGEDHRDKEEDRNSEEDDDDDDERFQATQTIPASPLLPAPTAPPPLSHPFTAAASAATAATAAGASGLAGGAARVITSGTLFFDGGSRGNPGIAGCGAVMYDDINGAKIWTLSAYLGHNSTNNQAEYAALCFGLEEALKRGVSSIQAFGDSTLVVKQVEGVWKVKNAGMKVWHAKALALKKKFKRFMISFVPREENGVADALANEGMDGRREGGPVIVEEG